MTDNRTQAHGRHSDLSTTPSVERRGMRMRGRAVVAGVIAGGVVAGLLVVGHDVALGSATRSLASDTFARTVRSGWGTAANGGSWTTSAGAPTFTVAKHTGRITLLSGRRPVATLKSVKSARTDLLVSVRASKAPTGGGTYVDALGRALSNGAYYSARLHLKANGTVGVSLVRHTAAGATAAIAGEAVAAGVPSRAGATTHVRLQVFGVNPTVVRARVWTSGQAEPAAWRVSASDSAAGLQTNGAVGVAGSLGAGTTNAPVMLSFTRVVATAVRGAGKAPVVTVPAAPRPKFSSSTEGAGSAPLGSTSYAVPAGAVFVATSGSDSNSGSSGKPVATLAKALALAPSGGTVVVRGGTYHQGNLAINKPVTVQSYPGEAVWFDGSSGLGGFAASGSVWSAPYSYVFDHSPTYSSGVADNSAQYWAFVNKSYPMASYPDMLWINGGEQRQVGALASVGPGSFYVDTANHRVYVGSNPTGASVSVSSLQQFLRISSTGVTLRGIGIRRYADSVPKMGALVVYGTKARLENVFIDDNATQGVAIGATGSTLSHVTAIGNGMLGIQAVYADGITIDHVVANANNDEHFNTSPVSGGIKITRSRGIVVRNSVLSDNLGQGVWADESSYNITIVDNDASNNLAAGIFVELSDVGTIANNVSTGNKDAGIRVQNSGHFQIWNNTLGRNYHDIYMVMDTRRQTNLGQSGHDPRQKLPDMSVPWITQYNAIHNNILDNSTGTAVLLVEDYSKTLSAESMHITTSHNAYVRASASSPSRLVSWSAGGGHSTNAYATLAAFQSAKGQEGGSVFATSLAALPGMTPAALPASIAPLVGQASGAQHLGAWR
jgi:parallel beta-helix repeat protein